MRDTHAGDGQMQDSEHPRSIELDASSQKRKVVLLANLLTQLPRGELPINTHVSLFPFLQATSTFLDHSIKVYANYQRTKRQDAYNVAYRLAE